MHDYKFLLNNTKDITDNVVKLSYSESLDDFASSFNFEYVSDEFEGLGITSSVNNKTVLNQLKILKNNKPVYVGYITDEEHTTDKNKFNYYGFDVGFYLNKNEVIKQFRNRNIGDAIRELCKEYQINIETMPKFNQRVSKFYKDVIFSDVVKELLQFERDKGGRDDFYVDCKGGAFTIREYEYNENLGAVIANNIALDSFQTINNVHIKQSMQELKNRVIYTDNDKKSAYKVMRQDRNSISTYGLLTDIERVDTKKENNLEALAIKKLDELNKIAKTISLSMLGDERAKKGIVIPLNISEYGLNGTYLITNITHNITSHDEAIDISVKKYEIETTH